MAFAASPLYIGQELDGYQSPTSSASNFATPSNSFSTNSQGLLSFGPTNTGSTSASTAFNANPSPVSGTNPFGYIPGNVQNPIPNASSRNTSAGNDIASELSGQLSPGTLNALQTAAAEFGTNNGMPGFNPGTLTSNAFLGNVAGASENLMHQGLSDYGSLTSPAFQTNLAQQNAVNAAAPDPTQAANYAQQLYNEYLQALAQGGGSKNPAGGTSQPQSPASPVSGGTNPNNPDPNSPAIFPFSNPGDSFDNSYGAYAGSGIGDYGSTPFGQETPTRYPVTAAV